MNSLLKKVLKERGLQKSSPERWQQNSGWKAIRCPTCSKPLHKESDDSYKCNHCGSVFVYEGWSLVEKLPPSMFETVLTKCIQ